MKTHVRKLAIIIVVMLIAGPIMVMMLPHLCGCVSKGDVARMRARSLETAVTEYHAENEEYPKDLNVLVVDGYAVEEALMDPWGGRYQIDPAGPMHDGAKPDILTINPRDGKKIGNWGK